MRVQRMVEAARAPARETSQCFSFVELCPAQAAMNEDASTSPIDGTSMALALGRSETVRALLLCILNTCYSFRVLLVPWKHVPGAPIPKPQF